jgi:alpha-1,2-mannosyltransferase
LVVSPVSWSHHWVWVLPAVLVTGILGWRRRNIALAVVSAAGVALMRWTPIDLLPKHHEETAEWWRQLAGMSYVWWALAVIATAGLAVTARVTSQDSTARADAGRQLISDVNVAG